MVLNKDATCSVCFPVYTIADLPSQTHRKYIFYRVTQTEAKVRHHWLIYFIWFLFGREESNDIRFFIEISTVEIVGKNFKAIFSMIVFFINDQSAEVNKS